MLEQAKLYETDIEPNPSKYFIAFPGYEYIYLFSKDEQNYLSDHNVSSCMKLYEFTKIGDMQIFFNADKDLQEMNAKVEYLKVTIDFLKELTMR